MTKSNFENLQVYQLAERPADNIRNIVSGWNRLAKDTSGKQIVGVADSIGAHIVEGAGRGGFQDNRQK